jgi:hypothetical protein
VCAEVSGNGIINSNDLSLLIDYIFEFPHSFPIFLPWIPYPNGQTNIEAVWKLLPNGKWGLFSNVQITNGDLIVEDTTDDLTGNFLSKRIGNKFIFVNSPDTTTPIAGEQFLILTADHSEKLIGIVNNGIGISVSAATGIKKETNNVPLVFALKQNYPNPFNPSTTISYQIPNSGFVNLKIYDITGKEVITLVKEQKSAGSYSVRFNANNLPSGIYLCKIESGNNIQTKKMMLMK